MAKKMFPFQKKSKKRGKKSPAAEKKTAPYGIGAEMKGAVENY